MNHTGVRSTGSRRHARRNRSFTGLAYKRCSARHAELLLVGAAEALLGGGAVAAAERDLGELAPCPARELALAELLGQAQGRAEVGFGLLEPAEHAVGVAALAEDVRQLPARAELGEDRHGAVQVRERLLGLLVVPVDPAERGRRDRHAELVTQVGGERERLLDQLARLLVLPGLEPQRGDRGEGADLRPPVILL